MALKKIISKYWPFIILLILSGITVWPIFLPGYFSHHDDLQVMRIYEMRRCLLDFQIPCRWVPDMGYGNGYPLFNYYNVLPYYIGAFASFILGFIGAAKLLFLIPLLLGGISIFLFAKEILGIYPALASSVLFMFAPYRALDTYVRGDVSESFSLAVIPLVLYFALQLIKKSSLKNKLGLTFSFAAFLTSHNILVMLFLPIIFLILTIWFWKKDWKIIKSLILYLTLGFGLSAFFLIPAFFEKNLVQIDNLIRLDLNFRAHFVTISQLFLDRFWGYGASMIGEGDTISFQIGLPHWILTFLSLIILVLIKKWDKRKIILYLAFFIFFLFSIFMTHIRSSFIWEKIDILKFTQFPWRFLSIAIFSASLLGGFFIFSLKESFKKYVTLLIIIITIVLNWNYFKPQEFYTSLTDKDKLSGIEWEEQQKAAILDYLPQGAVKPLERAQSRPIIIEGEASVGEITNFSNRWEFKADIKAESKIQVPVFNFPNWQVFANGKKLTLNKDDIGRINLTINPGNYKVEGKFADTPIRQASNLISLISLLIIFYLIYGKNRKANI